MRKVLAATLTCLIVLLWAMPSFAQTTPVGKFDVRLKLKSNNCVAKKVVLQVQVKAHDANSTFKLGDANFRFDYDPKVVINPKNISQETFSNAAPASDANYTAQTLTGSKVSTDGTQGIVSLNVLYSGSNAGAKQVGIDYITVACIEFDVIKTDGCVNFKWHTDNVATDFPITGMNEIIQTSADPYDYTNPSVPAGGVFENYNVCLNTLCVPVVNKDLATTAMNMPVSGNVLTNDTPTGGLTVKISPFPTPLHGSLQLSTNGAYTYTPTTGYVGKDSVQYEACDASNVCGKAWLVITVTGPSLAVNRDVYTTPMNTPISSNVLTNDTPPGGLTVKISPFPTPLHGSLQLSTNGVFTYTPSTGYVGKDSVQYEACDANNNCAKAWAVFTITGSAPVVNPDVYSTNAGTPVSGNVLTNDTPMGGLTVKISPLPMPLHGSLQLSTNGAFTYTPTSGYVGKDSIQYEACNGNNVCGKAWVVFTVNGATPPTSPVDLSLIKTVSIKKAAVGDLITYTVSITNQSTNTATGVSVKDYMPAGVLYKSYSTSTGTYNNTTGIWTIGNISGQQTINLVITVQAQGEGTFFNRAEVWTCNEPDVDSKPANTLLTGQPNNPILEDDNASACFYVPIGLCTGSGDAYEISVPTGYTGIQWYKNGSPIAGETGTTLTVSTVGSYTFTTLEGTCPAGGCCPAEFVPIDCCKPALCVPYAVIKTKSAKK